MNTCCFCKAALGADDRVVLIEGGRCAHKGCYDADLAARRAKVRAIVEREDYQQSVAAAWEGMEVWNPKDIHRD